MRIRNVLLVAATIAAASPVWALGGGRLLATQGIVNVSQEFSGPLAFGLSLIMIIASGVSWFRHHHDFGAIGNSLMGVLFIAGIALGANSALGMVPGVAGAII